MSVPGEFTAGDVLAASEVNALPGGLYAYAAVTANQTGITTEVDLTGMTVTITLPPGRLILVTAYARLSSSSGGGAEANIILYEGATVLQTAGSGVSLSTSTARAKAVIAQRILTPSTGAHTYKVACVRTIGTDTINLAGSATTPSFVLAEILGAA